ncbi:MAG: hypothetical protein ACE145_20325 [Terriglobia bacterium]
MNPLYFAVVNTVLGHRRRCPACGKEQIIARHAKDRTIHCKKCGHRFTKEELQGKTRSRD